MSTNKAKRTRKSAKPVIATLITLLQGRAVKNEGMTVPQLTNALHTATGRPAKSLAFTVRAQLSRLPGEKGIKIKKVRDGQSVRYFSPAAKKAA